MSSQTTAAALAIMVEPVPSSFGNFQPAIDHCHRPGAVRQHRQDLLLVHLFRTRHADGDLDLHGVGVQAQRRGDAERIVPQGIAQRAYRGLGRIGAADIGAHADFQHHAFQRHVRVLVMLAWLRVLRPFMRRSLDAV